MIKRKFLAIIILHILLIIGLSMFLTTTFQHEEKAFTAFGIISTIFLLSLNLIRYTNKSNREILAFFNAIQYEDYSFGLKKDGKKRENQLSGYIDELNELLSQIRIENEIQSQYLNTIVEHINIGLLAVQSSGRVDFFNNAAQKILNLHKIKDINVISRTYPEFGNILNTIQPGQQKLIKLKTADKNKFLSLNASTFHSKNNLVKLYSFQDIEKEIEETETETWKKLIRVLTHEINNSISPIHSLSDAITKQLTEKEFIEEDLKTKTVESLQIIRERSSGLLSFVDKFRSLTPKGQLNKEMILLSDLFYRLKILSYEYIKDNQSIKIESLVYPETLELKADRQYMEQVLINLLKNSIEAMPEDRNGHIQLKAFRSADQTIIEIQDNGTGIDEKEQENIFIPFYTTKKNGSGIGLSLSRQIVLMHGGNISVYSEPGKKTVFSLRF